MFCSLKKGITPKIRMLCQVCSDINSFLWTSVELEKCARQQQLLPCVCVCVWERERGDRQTDRQQKDRQRQTDRQTDRQRHTERTIKNDVKCLCSTHIAELCQQQDRKPRPVPRCVPMVTCSWWRTARTVWNVFVSTSSWRSLTGTAPATSSTSSVRRKPSSTSGRGSPELQARLLSKVSIANKVSEV